MNYKGLNSFNIKFIALMLMTIDHIGYFFFHSAAWFQIPGRLAAPLFVFIMVWSFDYTRNRKRMLTRLVVSALILDFVWLILEIAGIGNDSLMRPNILVTLSITYGILYLIEEMHIKFYKVLLYILLYQIVCFFLLLHLIEHIFFPYYWFDVLSHFLGIIGQCEGGYFWVILGITLYYSKNNKKKLAVVYTLYVIADTFLRMTAPVTRQMYFLEAFCTRNNLEYIDFFDRVYSYIFRSSYRSTPIVPHGIYFGDIQWYMIFALPIMLLYNNEKGRGGKYFYYSYYIIHVVVFYIMSTLL